MRHLDFVDPSLGVWPDPAMKRVELASRAALGLID